MGAEKKEETEEEDYTESKGSPRSKKVLLTLLCYVHLPTWLSTHPSIHPLTHPSIHPPTHSSTHPSIHSSTHPFIHSPIHPFIHPPIHPFIHPPIHPSECLPTSLPQKVRRFRIDWSPNVKEIKDSSDEVNNIIYYQSVLLYII